MKTIKSIETYIYKAPNGKEFLLVKLESNDGTIGAGEATFEGYNEKVKDVIDNVIAKDVVGKELPCGNYLESKYFPKERYGDEIVKHAISGVEIAAWDAYGKMLGQPIYKIIGGRAGLRKPFIGAAGSGAELTRVEVTAETEIPDVGEGNAVVDVRCELGKAARGVLLSALKDKGVSYIVGAFPKGKENEWYNIAGRSAVPMAARFSSRFEMKGIAESAPMSIVEADILNAGGITGLKLLSTYVETWYIRLATICNGGEIAAAASAQVLYSCTNADGVGIPTAGYSEIATGSIAPDDAPGHGIVIDWSKL